jgi:hypothetical protein
LGAALLQPHQRMMVPRSPDALRRQPKETQAQILARRGTLISLDAQAADDEWHAVCVMPYMADF